jgi:hypothetical protein
MDLPKQTIIIVFAQGILAILLIIGYARRSRREKAIAAASSATSATSAAEKAAGGPSWVWVAGSMAAFAAVLLFWRPVSSWYWSRHPPSIEHRSELLEAASHQLQCPAEQLTIEPYGDTGAQVTGCEGKARLCWRKTSRYSSPAWLGCFESY